MVDVQQQLINDMQRMAAVAQQQPTTIANNSTQQGAEFSALLANAQQAQKTAMQSAPTQSVSSVVGLIENGIHQVHQLQQNSKATSAAFQQGDPSVNLTDAMLASQKAGLGFEALRQFRNQLVTAYQSIIRMPI